MPVLLADPPPALYLVLLAIAVVTGALAARNQDRRSLIRFAVALAVLLAFYLIDKTNESPYEEAVRRVQAMAQAADAKNPEAFVEHMADSIEYRGSGNPTRITNQEFRTHPFWAMLRHNDVRVAVWNFSLPEDQPADGLEVKFSAKGESGGSPAMMDIRAQFRKQQDGAWKLAGFTSYKYASNELFPIPNLGR